MLDYINAENGYFKVYENCTNITLYHDNHIIEDPLTKIEPIICTFSESNN